jgi:hypothetical protein
VALALRCATGVGEDQDVPEHDEICKELLGYLHEHPDAMDTLTGIAGWWLPRHRMRVGVEKVAQALRTLEGEQLIERIGGEDNPLYRLRRDRRDRTEH